MKHLIYTLLLVTGISGACIAAAQFTADATSTTGASLSPTGANMTNNVNPNTLTSAQVMQIQQTLKNDGVAVNVDGVWSPSMTTALSQFQTAHGLPANGTLTAQTVTDLGVTLSANTPTGSSAFDSATNSNLSNTTGENQIQSGNAASMNNTISPAAGSNTTGTGITPPAGIAPPAASPISPTGPGNTITGGVGGATGSAGIGGTNGGSTGGVGGATGSAGTGGAAGGGGGG
jgi:hypothetical protein